MSRREKKHRTGAFSAQKQTVNNQSLKGCPPKGSRVKVRNDQSERIVEILTEYVTKEWTDEDKRRKKCKCLELAKTFTSADPGEGQGVK